MFRVTGMKILGSLGTHIFFWEKYNFMHFAFQHAKTYIFPENLKKNTLGFTSKFRQGRLP